MQDNSDMDRYYNQWWIFQKVCLTMARAREKELRPFGISRSQYAILFVLKNSKAPTTPAEIARLVFKEPHTVSGLVDRMEKHGLLRKARDLERKNLIRVVITEKGEEAYQRARQLQSFHRILSCLPWEEHVIARKYLEKILDKALEELGIIDKTPFP